MMQEKPKTFIERLHEELKNKGVLSAPTCAQWVITHGSAKRGEEQWPL